jgi:anthranilate phosphoribosyltransferase
MTAGSVPDLHRGVAMASDAIRSGRAIAVLDQFIEASRG